MNCQEYRLEISEAVDRGKALVPSIQGHMDDCAGCQSFYAEASELSELLGGSRDLEPSPFLWTRIEAQIASTAPGWTWTGWLDELGSLFSGPALKPVAAGLVLTLFLSIGLLTIEPQPDPMLLAELDAYELESSANPFADAMAESNRIIGSGLEVAQNPFERAGNRP